MNVPDRARSGRAAARPARDRLVRARLVLVGVIGFLLLNYPLLSLVDRATTVAGVPVLWAYLFGVWVLLIGVLALIMRRAE